MEKKTMETVVLLNTTPKLLVVGDLSLPPMKPVEVDAGRLETLKSTYPRLAELLDSGEVQTVTDSKRIGALHEQYQILESDEAKAHLIHKHNTAYAASIARENRDRREVSRHADIEERLEAIEQVFAH